MARAAPVNPIPGMSDPLIGPDDPSFGDHPRSSTVTSASTSGELSSAQRHEVEARSGVGRAPVVLRPIRSDEGDSDKSHSRSDGDGSSRDGSVPAEGAAVDDRAHRKGGPSEGASKRGRRRSVDAGGMTFDIRDNTETLGTPPKELGEAQSGAGAVSTAATASAAAGATAAAAGGNRRLSRDGGPPPRNRRGSTQGGRARRRSVDMSRMNPELAGVRSNTGRSRLNIVDFTKFARSLAFQRSQFNFLDGKNSLNDPPAKLLKSVAKHQAELVGMGFTMAVILTPIILAHSKMGAYFNEEWEKIGGMTHVLHKHLGPPIIFDVTHDFYWLWCALYAASAITTIVAVLWLWPAVITRFHKNKVHRSMVAGWFVLYPVYVGLIYGCSYWYNTEISQSYFIAPSFIMGTVTLGIAGKAQAGFLRFLNFGRFVACQTAVQAVVFWLYVAFLPSWFLSVDSEWERLAIRLLVHPLLFEVAHAVNRVAVSMYPKHLSEKRLCVFVIPAYVVSNLLGRFLVSSMSTLWGTVLLSVLLGVQELVLRTTTVLRDYLYCSAVIGAEKANELAFSDKARHIKGDILNIDIMLEHFGIFVAPVIVWAYRLQLSGTAPTVEAQVTSTLIQIGIEICVDMAPAVVVAFAHKNVLTTVRSFPENKRPHAVLEPIHSISDDEEEEAKDAVGGADLESGRAARHAAELAAYQAETDSYGGLWWFFNESMRGISSRVSASTASSAAASRASGLTNSPSHIELESRRSGGTATPKARTPGARARAAAAAGAGGAAAARSTSASTSAADGGQVSASTASAAATTRDSSRVAPMTTPAAVATPSGVDLSPRTAGPRVAFSTPPTAVRETPAPGAPTTAGGSSVDDTEATVDGDADAGAGAGARTDVVAGIGPVGEMRAKSSSELEGSGVGLLGAGGGDAASDAGGGDDDGTTAGARRARSYSAAAAPSNVEFDEVHVSDSDDDGPTEEEKSVNCCAALMQVKVATIVKASIVTSLNCWDVRYKHWFVSMVVFCIGWAAYFLRSFFYPGALMCAEKIDGEWSYFVCNSQA